MRWKLAHLTAVVVACAIALAVYRSLWGPAHHEAKVVFGAYLALLVTASIAAYDTEPRWRRAWLGYAAFGWSWLALVLRHYLGRVPDLYAENMVSYALLGMALGLLCAVTSHLVPGMRAM